METQRPLFKKNKLVIAVSLAVLGGALGGCSSDSDGVAAGIFTLLANGGTAGSGNGGDAGSITLQNIGPTGGVQIRKSGKANTNFSTPVQAGNASLGDNPLSITADTTLDTIVDIVDDGTGALALNELYQGTDRVLRSSAAGGNAAYATDPVAAAGTIYLTTSNNYHAFISSGSATPDTAFTGLSVAEGVTLTLGDNNGCSSRVVFANDIDNAGTITKVANSCEIYLYADKYLATGSVNNAGTMANTNAGSIYIYTTTGVANNGTMDASGFDNAAGAGGTGDYIQLRAGGYVLNKGMLDASGGDGMGAGGAARSISMYGAYTENTADLDLTGGNNTTDGITPGNGGTGGWFNISAQYVTNNTGNIDVSGGSGANGGNVTGNTSSMSNGQVGEVKNAGQIASNGGIGHTGGGGDGGTVQFYSRGGELRNSGDLSSAGGNSLSAASGGGDGGEIDFLTDGGENGQPLGNIEVSGNIDLSGGTALQTGTGSGGDAGELNIIIDGAESDTAAYNFTNQRAALLGYVSIDANGGDGGNDGGEGPGGACCDDKGIFLITDELYVPQTAKYSVGSVINEVPINARGGNNLVDGGEGGWGGDVEMRTSSTANVSSLNPTVTNSADVDLSGGLTFGTNQVSGAGGDLWLSGYGNQTNSGDLTSNGGAGGNEGGDAGALLVISVGGAANNSGVVTANGADGQQYGGHGGDVYLMGKTASNSGNVTINGANAVTPFATGTSEGGDGGDVSVIGAGLTTGSSNSGTISYTAGTGDLNGEEGCLRVGITFTGNCN